MIKKGKVWLSAKDYIFITFGLFLYAFGFSAFIAPDNIVIGGMAGLGQLIYYFSDLLFGHGVPIAISIYALNILLLVIAYKTVSRTFVIRTVFGVTVLALLVGILQPMFKEGIVHQETFMNTIIGGILCGMGIGLAFSHNGSSGGVDIIAAMVNKHSNMSVGRTMQICDFCIVTSSLLIPKDSGEIVASPVYGYVVLLISPIVADMIINSNRQSVQFTIFSKHWREIATAINNDAHRGCTVLSGMGWYSKQEVKILLVVCRKYEAMTVFRIIKSIDKDAFLTQANVNGVYGQGFDMIRAKMKESSPSHHIEPEVPVTPPGPYIPLDEAPTLHEPDLEKSLRDTQY
ncbi:MAG: YitT family protein [Muribaculaceae bacterium]|nr:YitT family protein [Muribaculaceae bacterium]